MALVWLVYQRVGEVCSRFERLAARFAAGTLVRSVGRAPRCAASEMAQQGLRGRAGFLRTWPFGFAWLVRAAGYQAAGFGEQIRAVLEHPDMVVMLDAAPRVGRLLRPICLMLGVERHLLRLPRRPSVAPVLASAAPEMQALAACALPVRREAESRWGRIALPRGVLAKAWRERVFSGS
jgi:hypothetical protein